LLYDDKKSQRNKFLWQHKISKNESWDIETRMLRYPLGADLVGQLVVDGFEGIAYLIAQDTQNSDYNERNQCNE